MNIAVVGPLRTALVLVSGIFAVTAVLLGCDSVSEFGRQNPNDPGSDQFTPDPPEALSIDIREDSALVTWQDGTEFESGYVVERMIDSSGTFTAVAELPRNTVTYRELLPDRGIYVTYRVRPVSDYANTDSVSASRSETAPPACPEHACCRRSRSARDRRGQLTASLRRHRLVPRLPVLRCFPVRPPMVGVRKRTGGVRGVRQR